MDLRILLSMLTMMFAGFLLRVTAAPVSEDSPAPTVSPERHARTKRCSCATFLDKECVYFCHLDIIWVNTPERVVSYGLGNAARRKRALREPVVPKRASRCSCVSEEDRTCKRFCQLGNHLRYVAARDKVILSAEGDACAERQHKHKHATSKARIRRMRDRIQRRPCPAGLMATLKTRLLLENWSERQHHKVKDWKDEVVV
ncbi:endothelin-1 [Osmerus mordax]|uniref:endothelin-1 n=1 Tax=Osmerus mordax TaxID=8014 RepID=UPI00350FCB44